MSSRARKCQRMSNIGRWMRGAGQSPFGALMTASATVTPSAKRPIRVVRASEGRNDNPMVVPAMSGRNDRVGASTLQFHESGKVSCFPSDKGTVQSGSSGHRRIR